MQRVITGFALAAGALAAIFMLPNSAFGLVLLLIGALALHELVPLVLPQPGLAVRSITLVGFVATCALLAAGTETDLPTAPALTASADLLLFLLLALPLFAALASRRRSIEERARLLPGLGFSSLYVGLAVISAWHLHRMDPRLLLVLIACVALGDSAAYYFGSAFGRHRLAPVVSPKKSWEGAAASFATALLLGAAAAWWLQRPIEQMLIAAAVASFFGQLGDLLESMIKRAASVKDSGTLLPGHGGVLDRVDALLLAAPPFRLILEWWT